MTQVFRFELKWDIHKKTRDKIKCKKTLGTRLNLAIQGILGTYTY